MNPYLFIPREALTELLRAAGSPLTPEQYLASLPQVTVNKKYASRATAAAVNKHCLLVVAILGVVLLPFLGFTIENLIIAVGLITVTFFEYRVHRYFREENPAAPSLGYRNQSCFAAAILVYCLYRAFAPAPISHDTMTLIEENNLIDNNTLRSVTQIFYLSVAIVAGGSQYGLAWYYRTAATKTPLAPPPFNHPIHPTETSTGGTG
jgi:hypothetical protein